MSLFYNHHPAKPCQLTKIWISEYPIPHPPPLCTHTAILQLLSRLVSSSGASVMLIQKNGAALKKTIKVDNSGLFLFYSPSRKPVIDVALFIPCISEVRIGCTVGNFRNATIYNRHEGNCFSVMSNFGGVCWYLMVMGGSVSLWKEVIEVLMRRAFQLYLNNTLKTKLIHVWYNAALNNAIKPGAEEYNPTAATISTIKAQKVLKRFEKIKGLETNSLPFSQILEEPTANSTGNAALHVFTVNDVRSRISHAVLPMLNPTSDVSDKENEVAGHKMTIRGQIAPSQASHSRQMISTSTECTTTIGACFNYLSSGRVTPDRSLSSEKTSEKFSSTSHNPHSVAVIIDVAPTISAISETTTIRESNAGGEGHLLAWNRSESKMLKNDCCGKIETKKDFGEVHAVEGDTYKQTLSTVPEHAMVNNRLPSLTSSSDMRLGMIDEDLTTFYDDGGDRRKRKNVTIFTHLKSKLWLFINSVKAEGVGMQRIKEFFKCKKSKPSVEELIKMSKSKREGLSGTVGSLRNLSSAKAENQLYYLRAPDLCTFVTYYEMKELLDSLSVSLGSYGELQRIFGIYSQDYRNILPRAGLRYFKARTEAHWENVVLMTRHGNHGVAPSVKQIQVNDNEVSSMSNNAMKFHCWNFFIFAYYMMNHLLVYDDLWPLFALVCRHNDVMLPDTDQGFDVSRTHIHLGTSNSEMVANTMGEQGRPGNECGPHLRAEETVASYSSAFSELFNSSIHRNEFSYNNLNECDDRISKNAGAYKISARNTFGEQNQHMLNISSVENDQQNSQFVSSSFSGIYNNLDKVPPKGGAGSLKEFSLTNDMTHSAKGVTQKGLIWFFSEFQHQILTTEEARHHIAAMSVFSFSNVEMNENILGDIAKTQKTAQQDKNNNINNDINRVHQRISKPFPNGNIAADDSHDFCNQGVSSVEVNPVLKQKKLPNETLFFENDLQVDPENSGDPVSHNTKEPLLTFPQFCHFLMDPQRNSWFKPHHEVVYQDMNQPLSHYYINSSHNTYITGNQFRSESSAEMYRIALLRGVRCVELDCWNGDDGFPVIYHGHTRTSKVSFESVVRTIKEFAFVTSPYPVILSLEVHCDSDQQHVMAVIFKNVFKESLLILSDDEMNRVPFPDDVVTIEEGVEATHAGCWEWPNVSTSFQWEDSSKLLFGGLGSFPGFTGGKSSKKNLFSPVTSGSRTMVNCTSTSTFGAHSEFAIAIQPAVSPPESFQLPQIRHANDYGYGASIGVTKSPMDVTAPKNSTGRQRRLVDITQYSPEHLKYKIIIKSKRHIEVMNSVREEVRQSVRKQNILKAVRDSSYNRSTSSDNLFSSTCEMSGNFSGEYGNDLISYKTGSKFSDDEMLFGNVSFDEGGNVDMMMVNGCYTELLFSLIEENSSSDAEEASIQSTYEDSSQSEGEGDSEALTTAIQKVTEDFNFYGFSNNNKNTNNMNIDGTGSSQDPGMIISQRTLMLKLAAAAASRLTLPKVTAMAAVRCATIRESLKAAFPCSVISFGEKRMLSLFTTARSRRAFIALNRTMCTRVYPKLSRINSSNFNPQPMWNVGTQIVALNTQTNDFPMRLNTAKFRQNGNCGYILKPFHLRVSVEKYKSYLIMSLSRQSGTLMRDTTIPNPNLPVVSSEGHISGCTNSKHQRLISNSSQSMSFNIFNLPQPSASSPSVDPPSNIYPVEYQILKSLLKNSYSDSHYYILHVSVICGHLLPKPHIFYKQGEALNPFVRLFLTGVLEDASSEMEVMGVSNVMGENKTSKDEDAGIKGGQAGRTRACSASARLHHRDLHLLEKSSKRKKNSLPLKGKRSTSFTLDTKGIINLYHLANVPKPRHNFIYCTKVVQGNGACPVWMQTFWFTICCLELASLTVQLCHAVTTDSNKIHETQIPGKKMKTSKNITIAEAIIPITSLRLGYRAVPLYCVENGYQIPHASILCHFALEGIPVVRKI